MADDRDAAIRNFKSTLKECMVPAVCGRSYVRILKLTQWLNSKVRSEGWEPTQVRLLLDYAYSRRDRPTHPITKEQLCDSKDGCLLIFCILLELDRGDLIDKVWRQDKTDNDLPIDLRALRETFEELDVPDSDKVAADFDKQQWKYCAAKLDLNKGRQYPESKIMPFHRREEINKKGGTAQLWQIEVLEEFVGPSLREAVKESRYDPMDDGLGPRYEFAVKTFEDGHRAVFINEREAFLALNKEPAMVQYLCEYGHKEKVSDPHSTGPRIVQPGDQKETIKTTHNIILEYGESDLEEYFAETTPPYLQAEVEAFWEDSSLLRMQSEASIIGKVKRKKKYKNIMGGTPTSNQTTSSSCMANSSWQTPDLSSSSRRTETVIQKNFSQVVQKLMAHLNDTQDGGPNREG